MSKRCCAKDCYNGQPTNRLVSYFAFPKMTYYAHKWAIAAGRKDLTKKSLNALAKYCLCSEHFTDECFINPKTKFKLKKSRCPLYVPLPTIFKNNLADNVKLTQIICKSASDKEIPTEQNVQNSSSFSTDDVLKDTQNEYDFDNKDGIIDTTDCIKDYQELNNSNNKANSNVIHRINIVEAITIKGPDQKLTCRFCGDLHEHYEMCPLFSCKEVSDFIARVMTQHEISENDGFPQNVCYKCSQKMKYCMGLITSFDSVQEKLKCLKEQS